MFSIYATTFLISLQIFNILYTRGSPSSTSSDTRITLPLTLIAHGYSYENPTKIDKAAWSKGKKALLGKTTFSREVEGRLTYLCAIKTPMNEEDPNFSSIPDDSQNQYCSYRIKFKPKETLQCVNDAEPFIEKLSTSPPPETPKEFRCGSGGRGKMYWFVYEICSTDKEIENEKILQSNFSFLESNPIQYRSRFDVYRFCYDEQANEVLYTHHQIKAPGLLEDENMKNERNQEFDMMTNGYHIFDSKIETMLHTYAQAVVPSNEDQPTTSSNTLKLPFKIQKLVLPEDLSFASWKKPTYHYLNTKLMHEELVPLWDHISNLIRRDAIKKQRRYSLYTGTFSKVQNRVITKPEESLLAPDIWLKVITYFYISPSDNLGYYKSLAIVIDNRLKDSPQNMFFQEHCQENLCEGAFTKSFPKVSRYVRCCKLTRNIISYFDKNLKASSHLESDFLFDE